MQVDLETPFSTPHNSSDPTDAATTTMVPEASAAPSMKMMTEQQQPTTSTTSPTTSIEEKDTDAVSVSPATSVLVLSFLSAALSGVMEVIDYVGLMLAGWLGITDSHFQYVIDAKERDERIRRMEEEEEAAAMREFQQKQTQQIETGQTSITSSEDRKQSSDSQEIISASASTSLVQMTSLQDSSSI